jgi:hypothetical protein
MIDAQIARATCQIKCGDESGTGWLITGSHVITARHCVDDAIEAQKKIEVRFEVNGVAQEVIATVVDAEITLDICLLLLEREMDLEPIVLDASLPPEGTLFSAFGFPMAKLSIGHRLEGLVSQVLESPKLGIDLDLQVEAPGALTNYEGISGAALICGGRCKGMLRLGIDKSLGAVSIARVSEFLRRNSIPLGNTAGDADGDSVLAPREEFTKDFDALVSTVVGGYAFIEGAHGIGKSTFCDSYQPSLSTLEHFGTYSFTHRPGTANPMHLAQPEVFFDWLNTLVSFHLTGSAGRVSVKKYSELITGTNELLSALARAYSSQGKIGIIFVDGLDEAAKLGQGILEAFIGLLPQRMPDGLKLVIAAPSYVQLSAALGARMVTDSCILMPGLTRDAARTFCGDALLAERASAATVRIICDRAQGHALYLRYLIDLANGGADDEQLGALPLINGIIRNYYESLWPQLLADPDTINLLAIIARLRWGIPTTQLAEILNDAERVVLVTTLARIRHLLLRPAETTIYHLSFADFLIEKTALRDMDVQHRLAEYCETHPGNRYGTLNAVYHGLRSESADEARAVASCRQEWVDRCVTVGAEPDILLSDVSEALAGAAKQGSLLEVVRLLLLSQRIQFRYDTLFALSADLAADALVALGKTQEALQHAVRHGRLIVPVHVALRLALRLMDVDVEAALDLLDKVDAVVEKLHASEELTIGDFITVHEIRTQILLLRDRAGNQAASQMLLHLMLASGQTIRASVESEPHRKQLLSDVLSIHLGGLACLKGRYLRLSTLRSYYEGSTAGFDQVLPQLLGNYHALCDGYGIAHDYRLLGEVFADIQTLLEEPDQEWARPSLSTTDAMVSLGTPAAILLNIVGPLDELIPFQFVAADNVSVDMASLNSGMARWRIAGLLDRELSCPVTTEIQHSDWQKGVESICRALAWCDGAARYSRELADDVGLRSVWEMLEQHVFERLRFTLAQRSEWKDSYGIPEVVFPEIYERLTDLITDVFPEHVDRVLSVVDELFAVQCGLYSEGFRSILAKVLKRLTKLTLDNEVEDQAFALLRRWRNFIQSNVKNRHELVPELLSTIPLFVRLGATEEAHQTYQAVLSFSMGPSWYKEDQLSLMTTALQGVRQDKPLEAGVLSRVAGCLEIASGEMTFQRFVRYDKAELLGILCGRGDVLKAVHYFRRQSCGTAEQLLTEATAGEIDRIAPLKGMRFPGGALDEQDALYRMLESVGSAADWPICWALLEIHQFGDSRHLERSAQAYARLAAQVGRERSALALMVERLMIICEDEFDDEQRASFISTLRDSLPSALLGSFEEVLGEAYEPTDAGLPAAAGSVAFPPDSWDSSSLEGEEQDESIRNAFVMPGMFGTSDSSRESEAAVARAERHLARGNTSAARDEALAALELLQHGGWSIWGNLSDSADRAEAILRDGADSTDSVVKIYGPLILSERHADAWRRAAHVIRKISSIATSDERAGLVQLVVEHIEILVGKSLESTSEYEFLEAAGTQDASSSLMELLLTTIDHPKWLRRDKASELILWLLNAHPRYIPMVGPRAFSMESTNLPDVLCGVLDHLSMTDPSKLWDQLAPALDRGSIQSNCKHVGRLGVLLRISERAALRGSESAEVMLQAVRAVFPQPAEGIDNAVSAQVTCPAWATTCEYEWQELTALGLMTQMFAEQAKQILHESCAPLPIETTVELEHLVARGVGDNSSHALGRWKAKVRYALQVALLPQAFDSLLPDIIQIFRVYNPSRISHLRVLGFASPSRTWLDSLRSTEGGGFGPTRGNDIYLDFFERVWDGDRYRSVRMTAFFYHADEQLHPPGQIAEFSSTELPESREASAQDVCARVAWRPVFFGSFTPAVPSARLMQMTNATGNDMTRANWRVGRTSSMRGAEPLNEGCFLAIKRGALRLHPSVRMAWLCEIDEKRAIISRPA